MPTNLLGNRDLIREINRSSVLNTIKTHGPLGRAEIARRTGLSPATITGITAELIGKNLVLEKSPGDSSGGRPPIMLALNPSGGFVIGIKLTENTAIAALTDLEATVIAKSTTALSGNKPAQVVQDLNQVVNSLVESSGVPKKQLLGVGIGLAGIVDSARGVLRQSPISGWQDVPLRDLLKRKLRVMTTIENDVNTLTLAEKYFGSGQGVDHFLVVTIGRGVGLGIVMNGRFYHGAGGGAGEFGHTVIDPLGPVCACGKHGCLETFVADPGLVRMANESAGRGELSHPVPDVLELLSLANSGEAAAQAIFARAGKILGQSVVNLIALFNPQKIIFSGEGTRAGDFLFKPMCAAIEELALPRLLQDARIQIDPWGDDAWARGAASLVLRELFEPPVLSAPGLLNP